MTKTKEERSKLRAEEHQHRRRIRVLLLIVALTLYVVVPLLWDGAVEFGWVHPIRTPEFQRSLSVASGTLLVLIFLLASEFLESRILSSRKEPEKPKDDKPPVA